ncbi:NADP-dependent oxidoreductase [Chitinophaga lutea]|uniref:NADP-dependent oxidoreductase n=1 Tax=Chitinophaga lutea TaxID=2488634 RepID=A0A3N4Q897_9BACT|nr:NADP-dependent oxidoreductase [Chitinophaga lutea]RPE07934.1 NADP-dependent oxidoreductase [Chitinophaga lutea]
MKAYLLQDNGAPEHLVLTETERPKAGLHEVLVRTRAIAINPVDAYVRRDRKGLLHILQTTPEQAPWILGWDVAGTVVETGEHATQFKVGDEVFGMVNFFGQGKAYAEYVAAPEAHLALKPAGISHGEAAAATLAALTAWQALVTHARVQQGEKVLIHAAAGGVGHYAVQIAKHLGAHVVATGSEAGRKLALSLGADEYIDYNQQSFTDVVKDADVVIEPMYPDEHVLHSIQSLRNGGRLISIQNFLGADAVKEAIQQKQLFSIRMTVTSNGNDMQQIAGLLADGHLRSVIAAEFDFSELPKAHEQIETGKTKGKIIVTL